jgi:predicted ATPase
MRGFVSNSKLRRAAVFGHRGAVLGPLARQIVAASARSQVIVVSHAAPLVDAIASARDALRIELVKGRGETMIANRGRLEEPSWKWTS